ncbi:MAG TPA: tetratricopeptide repeat protein [Pseudomonadales bacterium]|nr:tetratricopeptide repeat protein [Pseudomonadales bacterium]
MSGKVRDVTDAEFDTAVLARSKEIPVVVDLWAPWCGPCRQLGPVLEKIAAERSDDFELVKINVDENPVVAGQLGARSIPLVIGFKDGKPASQFVGAQPYAAVMKFIDALAPSKADRLVDAAARATAEGNTSDAETLLNQALETDRQHRRARLDLAELYVSLNRYEDALAALSALPAKPGDLVSRLTAEIRLRMAGGDLKDLEEKVSRNPDDLDAAIALGRTLGADGEYQRALDILLDAIRRDSSYEDGAARQAMIDLLATMGPEHPLTREYRGKLARAIH